MLCERQNKIMQGRKLSYMQMQGWVNTMLPQGRPSGGAIKHRSPVNAPD